MSNVFFRSNRPAGFGLSSSDAMSQYAQPFRLPHRPKHPEHVAAGAARDETEKGKTS